MSPAAAVPTSVRVGSGVGLLVGGLAYFLTLFDYAFDPLRTASAPGYWSNLYDIQARALLAGHLHVPPGSLGIEGIVHDGHTYMYFPMFPALLRMPVLLTTHEYDGKLTLLSMAIAWIVFATMATRLFWLVSRVVLPVHPVTRTHAALGAVFIAAATGGTTLTYDASQPWVYNEAYVWAVAAAVGAIYWMVRVLTDGEAGSVGWLAGFVLLSVLCRPTEGWAVGLVTIGIALTVAVGRTRNVARAMWWRILLAGVLPLAVGVVISELKFDSVYMHPLSEQVWTTVNEHRREALAANGGSLTGPQFFLTGLAAYFRLDGIRFVSWFPWITLPAHPPAAVGDAVVDQSYRTGSVPAFMPLLLLLTVLAAVTLLLPRFRRLRLLTAPLVAGVLVTGGVMGYGYYSMRYVTDFVPALVIGGAVGFALLARWLHGRAPIGVPVLAGCAVLAAYSLLAHMSVGYATAAVSAAGGPLRSYVGHQAALTGDALASIVERTGSPPTGADHGRTDELRVVGDCNGLYLDTGDSYRPWATVATRTLHVTIAPAEGFGNGTMVLATTSAGSTVSLQTSDGRARVVLVSPGTEAIPGEWHLLRDIGLRVDVENATELEFFRISTTPGGQVGGLPATAHDRDYVYSPVSASLSPSLATGARRLGLSVQARPGGAPSVCRDVERLVRPGR